MGCLQQLLWNHTMHICWSSLCPLGLGTHKPYLYYLNRWKLQHAKEYLLVQWRHFEDLHLWSAANTLVQNNSFWGIFAVVFQSWFQSHRAELVWRTWKYQGLNLMGQIWKLQKVLNRLRYMLTAEQVAFFFFVSFLHVSVKEFLTKKIFRISSYLLLSWATSPPVVIGRQKGLNISASSQSVIDQNKKPPCTSGTHKAAAGLYVHNL